MALIDAQQSETARRLRLVRRDHPPAHWYTTEGKTRLYCSVDCRNTANSRNSEEIRRQRTLANIAAGRWQNPAKIRPPTSAEQSARSRKGRLREVAEGRWRNPGLTPEARRINSQPHKHTGAVASAIEKLGQGYCMSALTEEEQIAYREYRRQVRRQRRTES